MDYPMSQITTGKMGIKGLIVMPQNIREMLGVEKGSTIAWVVTDDNRIEVRPLRPEAIEAPNEFELALKELGMTYEDWRAQRKQFAKKYRAEKLQKASIKTVALARDAQTIS